MDSTELNKIMAAFLTAGIVFGLGGVLGGKLIHSERPEHPAFAIVSALPEGVSAGPRAVPIATLLAHADPAKGQSDAAKLCGACHSFNKGGATMVGPNLYNMVMAPVAEGDGYDFSSGLKAHHGKWTFDDMSAWLKDPKGYAPGTKMAFAGITNDHQRADVIDYLRTLSDSPQPLPPVPKEAPAGAAAGAGGAPAAPSFAEEVGHADPKLGAAAVQRSCGACHSFDQGGATLVGPNLYNVVDRAIAAKPGYSYSAALTAKHAAWTYDNLNAWLTSPSGYASGTKMGFAGIPSEKQRAAVVDYLRTLSDNPHPIPAAGATPAAPAVPSFAEKVGHADPKLGGAAAQRYCGACHSFDQGGATLVGPNLYNVVDRAIAAKPGYSYSAALTAKHAAWTYDNLNAWLTSPSGYASGTKMGFAGIPSEKQRAAVVDYLRTLSPNPHPIPGSGAGGADKPGQGATTQSPGAAPK